MGGVVGWMVEYETLLSDQLGVGGRGACGLRRGHEDGVVGGDGGGRKAGCVHGMHGHVGAVRSGQGSVVGTSWMKRHHPFPVDQLLESDLVGLLRSPPLGSPVLEPNLQKSERRWKVKPRP